jgi:hypothetical protein
MSDDLVKRLDNLWSMLEDEGFYTKANTAILAKDRIEELEAKLAKAVEIIEAYGEDEGYVPRRVADIYDELKGETDE